LKYIGRSEEHIERIEKYLKAVRMIRNYDNSNQDPIFSEVVTLNLETVVSSVSGPKRPHDRVAVVDMKKDFNSCLTSKVSYLTLAIIINLPKYSINRRKHTKIR
jgi:aconitate hydratase